MSDVICLMCGHGPHTTRPCMMCECKTWVRADLQAYRAIVSNTQELQSIRMLIGDILALLVEVFPEQTKSVDAKREEARKKFEQSAQETATQEGPTADGQTGPSD